MDEHLRAVRQVREEAERLRLACVELAGTSTFLHIAYNQGMADILPATFMGLLKQMK